MRYKKGKIKVSFNLYEYGGGVLAQTETIGNSTVSVKTSDGGIHIFNTFQGYTLSGKKADKFLKLISSQTEPMKIHIVEHTSYGDGSTYNFTMDS